MRKKIDYVELVTKTVMWILGVIAIYMLILKILGHSPTTESIIMVVLGIMGTNLLFLNYKMGKQEGKFNYFVKETFPRFERNIRESFDKVKEDLKEIKEMKK